MKEVNIAVMGCTGSGKTTFVNLVSNSNLRIGVGLESCTDVVQKSLPFEFAGYTVTLVDTPGFDDTSKSDSDVLSILCDYFREEFAKRRTLHGVLYFHRITDNRMSGSGLRSLRLFQNLCGTSALKNCVVVTNMWNQIQPEIGTERETELKSKDIFFKPVLDCGAILLRHDNTLASAQDIIRPFLSKKPEPLAIQIELVREKMPVYQTKAGEALLGELGMMEQNHQREMEALQRELEEARREHDEVAEAEIQEATENLERNTAKLADERSRLLGGKGATRKDRIRKRDRLRRLGRDMMKNAGVGRVRSLLGARKHS